MADWLLTSTLGVARGLREGSARAARLVGYGCPAVLVGCGAVEATGARPGR